MAGTAVGVVALTLVVLSLTHLSHGIVIVTNAPTWEAWALAIGLDLGFVAFELALLTAPSEKMRTKRAKWARPAIVGLLVGSAGLNALAFAHASSGYLVYPAAAMGLAIPAVIYALTRTWATILIDRSPAHA